MTFSASIAHIVDQTDCDACRSPAGRDRDVDLVGTFISRLISAGRSVWLQTHAEPRQIEARAAQRAPHSAPLAALSAETGGGGDKQISERLPQRKDSIVCNEVPAQGSVRSFAGVQLDVFDQEMLERAKRGLIPIRRCQHCTEHGLEAAILVTRQCHCPRQRIHAADFGEIFAAKVVYSLSRGLIQARRTRQRVS